jgi:serine O-acetyltransferase
MLRGIETMMNDLRRDASRYESLGGWARARGFWIGATYRFGRFARPLPVPLRIPAALAYELLVAVYRNLYHVEISREAEIGPGLCLIHPFNILLGPSKIGENILVFHDVTIGTNARDPTAFPRIGNDVDVYVGARLLGRITIGDDVKVGANCVVTEDVPSGAAVVPAANRVIPPAIVAAFGPRHERRVERNGKRI